MELTLISTELTEETIQLTYTDGQSEDNAKQLLIVRLPFEGDFHHSVAWNQLRAISTLADWANDERRRIRDEIEKNL